MKKENLDIEAIVRGNATFAFDLYGKLREAKGNLFFSPYSISTALAMTYAGARGNTEKQLAQTLHFTLGQGRVHPAFASLEARLNAVQGKGHIQLSVANAMWPQRGYAFLEEFLALTRKYYGVLVTSLDYNSDLEAARTKINTWVEGKTANKIKDLIVPGILDPLTRLVLVNAIYFKGNWANQFKKRLTKDAPFWIAPEKSLKVPMMIQKQKFRYGERDDLQILELPYTGNDLSMVVLLPRKVDGLAELEKTLTVGSLEKWTRRLIKKEVQVIFPRFKMDSQFELGKTLALMGVIDAFFEDRADFSGMDGRKPWLYISAVIHKAFVDVNEEGTEAAAATAGIMKARCSMAPKSPPIFRADHPFVFLIRDNHTGSLLFLGRVVNPIPGTAYR